MVTETSSNRPLKRYRSKEPELYHPPRRPADLWFDDGSVVLETRDNAQYRVYHRTLSMYSPVMRQQLEAVFSQDKIKREQIDGCPLWRVDDTGDDMEHLLKALFDRRYYAPKDPQPFACVAAISRLAAKYEIEFLLEDCISRLERKYPTKLEDFYQSDFATGIVMTPGQHYDVITLAQEINMKWILPSAFLLCWLNRNYRINITKGMPRPDNSLATLSMQDQGVAIVSWDKIHLAIVYKVFGWLDIDKYPTPKCEDFEMCSKIRTAIATRLVLPDNIPFRGWEEHPYVKQLCSSCVQIARPVYEMALEKFWNDLPACFGLPGWDRLTSGQN